MKFSSSFTVVMKTSSGASAAFFCRHIKYKIHAPECTKTRHFYFLKFKNFLGRGHSPLPQREGDACTGIQKSAGMAYWHILA